MLSASRIPLPDNSSLGSRTSKTTGQTQSVVHWNPGLKCGRVKGGIRLVAGPSAAGNAAGQLGNRGTLQTPISSEQQLLLSYVYYRLRAVPWRTIHQLIFSVRPHFKTTIFHGFQGIPTFGKTLPVVDKELKKCPRGKRKYPQYGTARPRVSRVFRRQPQMIRANFSGGHLTSAPGAEIPASDGATENPPRERGGRNPTTTAAGKRLVPLGRTGPPRGLRCAST